MTANQRGDNRWWRPQVSVEVLIALVSAYFLLVTNGPLWAAVRAGTSSTSVMLSLGVAVFALHALIFGLLCWGRLARPLLARRWVRSLQWLRARAGRLMLALALSAGWLAGRLLEVSAL